MALRLRQDYNKSMLIFCILIFSAGTLLAQDFTMSEKLVERFTGPFHFRFILQPLVAIIFGLKDGKTDAKLKKPPYIAHLILDKQHRLTNFRQGLMAIYKPLLIGVILDVIVQIYLFHSVRLWGAVVVGALIIALPYALARGLRNRLSKPSQ